MRPGLRQRPVYYTGSSPGLVISLQPPPSARPPRKPTSSAFTHRRSVKSDKTTCQKLKAGRFLRKELHRFLYLKDHQ